MPIIKFKPVTPTRRFGSAYDFKELTTSTPYRPLTEPRKRSGGRNNLGHTTIRFRGGGHKRRIRIIDFKRNRYNQAAVVKTVEYDPNRSSRVALIEYPDGQKTYILSPDGLKVGEKVGSGENMEVQVGNHLPLRKIPPGTPVHNIELDHNKGGQLVRSAGGVAQIMSKEENFANIKLPSGEIRKFSLTCYATVGQCSNIDHEKISLGKAGRKRWLGKRPHNRGVSMNPVDHPLGGGEGKTSGGRHPCSPTGLLSKGYKTRSPRKSSSKYIVSDRRSK